MVYTRKEKGCTLKKKKKCREFYKNNGKYKEFIVFVRCFDLIILLGFFFFFFRRVLCVCRFFFSRLVMKKKDVFFCVCVCIVYFFSVGCFMFLK